MLQFNHFPASLELSRAEAAQGQSRVTGSQVFQSVRILIYFCEEECKGNESGCFFVSDALNSHQLDAGGHI